MKHTFHRRRFHWRIFSSKIMHNFYSNKIAAEVGCDGYGSAWNFIKNKKRKCRLNLHDKMTCIILCRWIETDSYECNDWMVIIMPAVDLSLTHQRIIVCAGRALHMDEQWKKNNDVKIVIWWILWFIKMRPLLWLESSFKEFIQLDNSSFDVFTFFFFFFLFLQLSMNFRISELFEISVDCFPRAVNGRERRGSWWSKIWVKSLIDPYHVIGFSVFGDNLHSHNLVRYLQ